MNRFPSYKTASIKECPLTKKCGCWISTQCIGCCTGVVGTCSLHFRNIQVLRITEIIFYITRAPRNCRCWVSFHFTVEWCSLFTANIVFQCSCNFWMNWNELETTRSTIKQKYDLSLKLKLNCGCTTIEEIIILVFFRRDNNCLIIVQVRVNLHFR